MINQAGYGTDLWLKRFLLFTWQIRSESYHRRLKLLRYFSAIATIICSSQPADYGN